MFSFALAVYSEHLVHRYFGHRCFSTSRAWNLVLATIPCHIGSPPLYFANTHRRHHKFCEQDDDPHSPVHKGFLYAYMFWLADRENFKIREEYVEDWLQYPELLLVEFYAGWIEMTQGYLVVKVASLLMAPGWFVFSNNYPFMVAFVAGKSLGCSLMAAFAAFSHVCPFWPGCLPLWPCKGSGCLQSEQEEQPGKVVTCMATRRSWYWWIAGSETDHDVHHACPIYAVYGPWYHDWSYCTYAAMEKCGLVWSVKTPWKKGWKDHSS